MHIFSVYGSMPKRWSQHDECVDGSRVEMCNVHSFGFEQCKWLYVSLSSQVSNYLWCNEEFTQEVQFNFNLFRLAISQWSDGIIQLVKSEKKFLPFCWNFNFFKLTLNYWVFYDFLITVFSANYFFFQTNFIIHKCQQLIDSVLSKII